MRNQRIPASHIAWDTVPDFEASSGAFDEDISQYVTDRQGHTLAYSISPTSPSSESEITAAGLTLDPDTGHLAGTYDGETELSVVVRATDADSLESDWLLRSGQDAANPQTGVVWFHDFRSDDEVDAFRWKGTTVAFPTGSGNDPGAIGENSTLCRRITSDGMASGACLEILRAAGDTESAYWWHPFSPMTAPGNGKSANDPGANGTISAKTWAATQNGSELSDWNQGWYGHATYASADPTHFDGNDFYVQVVCKMDPRRITGGNEDNTVGKFIWFTTAEGAQSLSNGEHVCFSNGTGGNQGTHNYVRMYALGRTGAGAFDPLNTSARIQENSDVAEDWYYSGNWDVLLFHIRPGQIDVTSGANSTKLEIWAAHQGETSYTKIWNQEYGLVDYEARNGLQALILAAYENDDSHFIAQDFYHRYAQVIFSKNTIPCPQVWPS